MSTRVIILRYTLQIHQSIMHLIKPALQQFRWKTGFKISATGLGASIHMLPYFTVMPRVSPVMPSVVFKITVDPLCVGLGRNTYGVVIPPIMIG